LPPTTPHRSLSPIGERVPSGNQAGWGVVRSGIAGKHLVLGLRSALIAVGLLIAATGCLFRTSGDLSFAPLLVGRPMYQMDAQHSGRSPHIGPRQLTLLRTFDTAQV